MRNVLDLGRRTGRSTFSTSTRQSDGDRGASAVEYGLLVAALAAAIMIVVFALGGTLQTVFDSTSQCIAAQADAPDACPPAAP